VVGKQACFPTVYVIEIICSDPTDAAPLWTHRVCEGAIPAEFRRYHLPHLAGPWRNVCARPLEAMAYSTFAVTRRANS
jgi:hypothetical protein